MISEVGTPLLVQRPTMAEIDWSDPIDRDTNAGKGVVAWWPFYLSNNLNASGIPIFNLANRYFNGEIGPDMEWDRNGVGESVIHRQDIAISEASNYVYVTTSGQYSFSDSSFSIYARLWFDYSQISLTVSSIVSQDDKYRLDIGTVLGNSPFLFRREDSPGSYTGVHNTTFTPPTGLREYIVIATCDIVAGELRIYEDGQNSETIAITPDTNVGTGNFVIGGTDAFTGLSANGLDSDVYIAEIRLYNRTISIEEGLELTSPQHKYDIAKTIGGPLFFIPGPPEAHLDCTATMSCSSVKIGTDMDCIATFDIYAPQLWDPKNLVCTATMNIVNPEIRIDNVYCDMDCEATLNVSDVLLAVFGTSSMSGICDPIYIRPTIRMPASLNLFLHAGNRYSLSDALDLFTKGIASGVLEYIDSLDLFINGAPIETDMNLFVAGEENPISMEEDLNLYLFGTMLTAQAVLDLFLLGEGGSVSETLDLFIQGLGITPGSIPASGSLNLYLHRPPAVSSSLDLYIFGQQSVESDIDLYLFGIEGSLSETLDLYMNGLASKTTNLNLFTRGF